MSKNLINAYRARLKRMGTWMRPRYLRNQGVSFEDAHMIIFGRAPRF
jgi:hypothetical protein